MDHHPETPAVMRVLQIFKELGQELADESVAAAMEAQTHNDADRRDDAYKAMGRSQGLQHAAMRIIDTFREHALAKFPPQEKPIGPSA